MKNLNANNPQIFKFIRRNIDINDFFFFFSRYISFAVKQTDSVILLHIRLANRCCSIFLFIQLAVCVNENSCLKSQVIACQILWYRLASGRFINQKCHWKNVNSWIFSVFFQLLTVWVYSLPIAILCHKSISSVCTRFIFVRFPHFLDVRSITCHKFPKQKWISLWFHRIRFTCF